MTIRCFAAAIGLTLLAGPALAQRVSVFPQASGQEVYETICQGCHMPDAKGAKGAGAYPALAGNPRLASKEYPAMVVLRGQKAMPEFGSVFSDDQVAGVVGYVRTHFGNNFSDALAPGEVKALRAPAPAGTVAPPG